MKLTELANALRKQGHNVTLYKRPDGGYRVSSIDGLKFSISGNTGNDYARGLLGDSLSAKQYEQRAKARPLALEGKQDTKTTFVRWRKSKRKDGEPVKERVKKSGPRQQSLTPRKGDTAEERREKNRVRRMRRRLAKHGVETTASVLRKRLKYSTLTELTKILTNKSRHEAGLAYAKAVDDLSDFVAVVADMERSPMSDEFKDAIRRNLDDMRLSFAEAFITKVYNALYEIQKKLRTGIAVDWEVSYNEILGILAEGFEEGQRIADEWEIDLDA